MYDVTSQKSEPLNLMWLQGLKKLLGQGYIQSVNFNN
jgi:hypothetical protein